MRRISLVALFAAPLLFMVSVSAWPSPARANPPTQCHFGSGRPTGFCLGLFSKLHQHGPLFNYGPYYGYPPFEPYGPWNPYLQYNPWADPRLWPALNGHGAGGSCAGCGFHGCWSLGGWFKAHLLSGLSCRLPCRGGCHTGGCHTGGCLTSRCHTGGCYGGTCGLGGCGTPGCHTGGCHTGGCHTGGPSHQSVSDPVHRFSGIGEAGDSAVFYDTLPTILPASAFAR